MPWALLLFQLLSLAFLCLVLFYIWARVCSGLEKFVTYSLCGASSVLAVAEGNGLLPVGCIPYVLC